jgi:hypothetical protein
MRCHHLGFSLAPNPSHEKKRPAIPAFDISTITNPLDEA